MKQEEKNCIGMFRPLWEDIKLGGYVQCSCEQVLQTVEQSREHWQLGHFDTPIYKKHPKN